MKPASSSVAPAPALSSRHLGVRFGGHQAVDDVSADFYPGTLSVIVGPNGAGKTTYFNLLSGQIRETAGQVCLGGHDITRWSAARRARAGVGRAFQLTQLFAHLSVLENVRLAAQSRRPLWNMLSLWSDDRALIERAWRCLEQVCLSARAHATVATLPHGDKRKLELAVLLALEPTVLMLDEPTAGMSVDEVPVMLELIETIKAQAHHTILLVEHKMDIVRQLADRILVLHQGRLIADGTPHEVMALPIVQSAYLGNTGATHAVH